MYLISVYFDDETNKKLQRLINHIAKETGNTFMTENHVPPHITVSSIEARDAGLLMPAMESLRKTLCVGAVQFVSVGALLPYVVYAAPVLNKYLQDLSTQIYDALPEDEEITVSKFYRPMEWLPHVTLGKKLSKEQMQMAFEIMQEHFVPFEGKVTSIGLAKTNPHEDVIRFELRDQCEKTISVI